MMKRIHLLLLVCITTATYSQIIRVEINAACLCYLSVYGKAFAAVRTNDDNWSNSLVKLDPYTGAVENHLPLAGEPQSLEVSPDPRYLYVTYMSVKQFDKIDLELFQVVATTSTGEFTVIDLAVLPTDADAVIVSRGEGGYPRSIVMYREGILQPKQVDMGYDYASALCINHDATLLYGHNGISTGFDGYIMQIVADGVEYDGTVWEYMLASFGDIKISQDLVFDRAGHVLDAFSDSIPKLRAHMPLYLINWTGMTGFEYSPLHQCYVFGHDYFDDHAYISFFDGQYSNYLGSLETGIRCDNVNDLDVVDASHFLILVYDIYNNYRNSILICSSNPKGRILLQGKETEK